MRFIGVERRAADAKRAANRLRWEIDYAVAEGRAADAACLDVAELVGIMSNVLATLGEVLPVEPTDELDAVFGAARARFVADVNHFITYHRVVAR
jgi:hypothetical protein